MPNTRTVREVSASPPQLSRYLTGGYALLIVYASLSPFTGWRDQGLEFSAVLRAPLWQTYTPFDAVANLLAYIPLGLLLGLALHARFGAGRSVLLATLAGTMLSGTMEYAQMYLPVRTSSNLDLLTNGGGALAGALLGAGMARSAWMASFARWRQGTIRPGPGADFGLALIALWMFAQMNPSLPMLGNIFISAAAWHAVPDMPAAPFNWLACVAVALNLLALGCLMVTLWHRQRQAVTGLVVLLCAVALVKFLAAALLLKSWALLLWLNREALLGMFAGLLLLAAIARLPGLWVRRCAALSALAYLGVAYGMLDSGPPANAAPLYQWNEGHMLTYNGLSRVLLLLFPLLVLSYCGAHETGGPRRYNSTRAEHNRPWRLPWAGRSNSSNPACGFSVFMRGFK